VLLFAAVGAVKLAATGTWMKHLAPALLALYGVLSVLFPDEVASTTGGYGWTRNSWWEDPPEAVRWLGVVFVLGAVGAILAG
jgi:protein-S-isoprenylcysteine O-methyltransferase Ste14